MDEILLLSLWRNKWSANLHGVALPGRGPAPVTVPDAIHGFIRGL